MKKTNGYLSAQSYYMYKVSIRTITLGNCIGLYQLQLHAHSLKHKKSMNMGSNSIDGQAGWLVEIPETDMGRLAKNMKDRISHINPELFSKPDAGDNPCIFRLTRRFKNIKHKPYEPQMVSIGPYHNGEPRLQQMEELKWRCLAYLLSRPAKTKAIALDDYLRSLHALDEEARACYAETINLNINKFLEMMVLDGCFILVFLNYYDKKRWHEQVHPLAQMETDLSRKIFGDLLLLENQIPFIVLEKLFEISKTTLVDSDQPLSLIAGNVFSTQLGIPYYGNMSWGHEHKGLHLLDMVRSTFIPPDYRKTTTPRSIFKLPDAIPCISKLRRAGIKVSPGNRRSLFVVKLRNGVIEMPSITLDDLMSIFLVNCVAFEQFHNRCSHHFSIYVSFLDWLVNTARDIQYLCDRQVLDNYFGTGAQAANFINNLGKDLSFDLNDFYLHSLLSDVEDYYRNRLNWQWASFKREYFGKPWLLLSGIVALVLLVLTFLQTYYTMHPKH